MGFLVLILIVSVIFAFFDSYRFIQYDGSLKRGIKIGSNTLSSEKIQYFRSLKIDVVGKQTSAFIRKEGQIVLIQPIPYFTKRTLGLWYIGLVDLSKKTPQIEFRTPVSALIISIILTSLLVYQLFYDSANNAIGIIITFLFFIFFFVMTHPFSKYIVIAYIEETMQSKRSKQRV